MQKRFCFVFSFLEDKKAEREQKIKRSPGGSRHKRHWESCSHWTIKHEGRSPLRLPLHCRRQSVGVPDVNQTCFKFHCFLLLSGTYWSGLASQTWHTDDCFNCESKPGSQAAHFAKKDKVTRMANRTRAKLKNELALTPTRCIHKTHAPRTVNVNERPLRLNRIWNLFFIVTSWFY